MKKYQEIIKELEVSFENLEIETENVLVCAQKGICMARRGIKDIRKSIVKYKFKDKEEEINFFKKEKPKIYSKLIYYVKLFCIENRKPRSSTKNQIKFLSNEIDKLQQYFNNNLDFCLYYKRNATIFDEQYFLRGKEDIRLFPDSYHFYTDEEFSTSHDSTAGTILAYDMLIIYLKKELDKLEDNGKYKEGKQQQPNIIWTSQKVNLIELIYALHSTDVINNGAAEIKEIARIAERIFKIDLGDYYRAFLEIRMRKKGRTKFLDLLKENLEKRMDEIDD